MMYVEAVSARQYFVDQRSGVVALGSEHATITGSRGATSRRGATRQRHFRIVRQGAKTHATDHYRDIVDNRLGSKACAQHGLRIALLTVTFERDTGERAKQKSQVIETGQGTFAQLAEAADAVAAELGFGVNVINRCRIPHCAGPEHLSHRATFQVAKSVLSKFHNLRPASIFLNS